jgi:hypothetical protein
MADMSGPLLTLALAASPGPQFAGPEVDFAREVRPILSEHCFTCHGPDEAKRSAGLRLDTPEGLLAALPSGGHAVVPGKLDESELAYRLSPELPGDVMPPAAFGKPLKEAQVATLKRWIEEGARWEAHWSFVAPAKPPLPPLDAPAVAGVSEIDRFVRAALAERGLSPSAEADRATLLRRVTLDLTGLPPTLEELDRFLADTQDGAYERAVERLLASPRYGEHMARVWLDAARYGDTHGLHLDNERSMWPYRDWVVRAFNDNLPFDEFTVWQLAGDLLPEPTQDQLIASGFNRCNPTSAEGGMIAEEYLTIYAKDRVDTTASIWLGVTMGCAQCHDHKYDPFTQRDYYQLYAFFNSLAEEASDENIANPRPFLRVPTETDRALLAGLNEELARLDAELTAPNPALDAREARWATERGAAHTRRWLTWLPEVLKATNGAELTLEADGAVRAGGANPDKTVYELRGWVPPGAIERLRLEALLPSDDAHLPGRSKNQNFVLSELEVEVAPAGSDDFRRVELTTAVATHSQPDWPVAAILDGKSGTGWAGQGLAGPRHAEVTARAPFGFAGGSELRVRLAFESVHVKHSFARLRIGLDLTPARATDTPSTGVGLGVWHRAFFPDSKVLTARDRVLALEASLGSLDLFAGDVAWTPEPGWREGEVHMFPEVVGSMALVRYMWSDVARHVVATLGSDDSVQVWVNGALVHDNPTARAIAADSDRIELELRPGLNEIFVEVSNHGGGFGFQFRTERMTPFAESPDLALALARTSGRRSDADRDLIRRSFRAAHAPEWIALADARSAKAKELADAEAKVPTTMISGELSTRRPAHILMRGAYDKPGEAVAANVPAALPPLPADAPRNRLALARWLVDPANPLTARVTVNRAWQHFFGRGLVATPEDFGAQGEFPTHPELLDWLAVDFVERGWDVKALHRELVTSATYRQRAHIDPHMRELDPGNRLLARAARIRLDAEVLRDQALFVSELLDGTLGGPGVRPYQPAGIWEAVGYSGSNTVRYVQGPREHLHRRSLYTFWKRTAPPPLLTTFDAPSREACTLERERTNTPLQALAALNETTLFEAARFLAARVLARAGDEESMRLARLFRLTTGRSPDAEELGVLARALAALRAEFTAAPARAEALLEVGDLDLPGESLGNGLGAPELAAWTMLASTVMNLDEVLVRN